ncbi:hypothetical protein PV682_31295 [Streptomyces niveiscabiei]|uniref:hypothetical protein n=1 Tax=Streptomyces niveiscabiei TaxID=164115 RepID=UPI0029BADCD1|nr:hypothetical protein [Streptomyces niveiscabiei]MDX3385910.1 hypothetical protein [Streptomyces niveiscabiei]
MTTDLPTPAAAEAALAAARSARTAAVDARRVPAWHPPAAGLLYAAGFTGLALLTTQDHPSVALMLASVACLLGFLALFVANARAGGVLLWPTGTARERWLRHSPALLSTAAAVVAAFAINTPAALAVFGITQGALTWLQLHRARTKPRDRARTRPTA